jgi:hypothetical protein
MARPGTANKRRGGPKVRPGIAKKEARRSC